MTTTETLTRTVDGDLVIDADWTHDPRCDGTGCVSDADGRGIHCPVCHGVGRATARRRNGASVTTNLVRRP